MPSQAPCRDGWWASLGFATAALFAGAAWLSRDLRQHLRAHLFLLLLAGLTWVASLALIRGDGPSTTVAAAAPATRRQERSRGAVLLAVALLLRLPGWLAAPRHSDDVYRYLWDGAAQQAGLSPYLGPPGAPAYAPLREAHPELLPRINNRHLPTIYPPMAQLGFRLGAALGGLRGWRLVCSAADLLVLALLVYLCREEGRDLRWAAAWGWSPLCALELAQNAHMDALAIAPLLGALALWRVPAAAGALLGAAALGKPLAAALLPAALRLPRRAQAFFFGAAAMAAGALLVPHRGAAISASLGEYGRRWRGNDGAFALLQGAAEALVAVLYRPPYHEPWRLPSLARLVTGRARDTVWPDELSAFIARCAVVGLLGALAWALARGRLRGLRPAAGALLLVTTYLLLTPMLHPWYALWALCLAPLAPRLAPPALTLAALAPLAYLPLDGWLLGQPWREPLWARLLLHGAAWAAALLLVAGGAEGRGARFDGRDSTKYSNSI